MVKAPVGVMAWVGGSPKGRRAPAGAGPGADSEVAEKVSQPRCPVGSLDAVVLLCKLLIIEAKLVHEGGRHLLDLVLGESLGEMASQGRLSLQEPPKSCPHGVCVHVRLVTSQQHRLMFNSPTVSRGPLSVSGPGGLPLVKGCVGRA